MAGTISKVGNKWKVTLDFGKDSDGKRIRKCITSPTEADAKQVLNEHNYKQQINQVALPKTIVVSQISEMWMENKVKLRCAKTTTRGYQNILKNHFNPYFDNKQVQKIKPSDVEKYFKYLLDKGIGTNTLYKHWQLAKQVFDYAISEKLIIENPVINVELPDKVKIEINFINAEQMKILLMACEGEILQTPVYLGCYFGLRRSEICGLKWDHVDFDKKIITIREARFVEGGEKFIKPPKSKNSFRVLHMSDTIYEILQQEKARQEQHASDYRGQYKYSGYIYVNTLGEPYKPNTLSEQFNRFIKKNNLPEVTLHGLRHSFTSIGIQNGITMFDMSKTLGHSSIKVTDSIYAHLIDKTHKDTMETISDILK